MESFSDLGIELDFLLKLRTPCLGIKLFEKIEDIPKEFEILQNDVMVCQVIGMARYNEKAVAATKYSANACSMGGASIGLYKAPDNLLNGTRNAGVWAEDILATKKIMVDRMSIEFGKFEAFGVSPLRRMPIRPDIVQAFGNTDQILACVYAQIWDGGDKLELSTNGHGASCNEVLTVPYLTGKIRLALADIGEKRHAAAQEELIIGIPISRLERLIRNLKEASSKGMYKYPLRPYFAPVPEFVLKRVSNKY